MMFLDCPAYLDQEGAVRCGLPAEVRCRGRHARRPNSAPAYYLGRPARQWVTIMGPRRTAGSAPAAAPRPVLGGRAR
jgi:hypothetical protein